MNIVLLENTRILSKTEKLKSKFPNGAILYANRANYSEVIDKIAIPHLISDNWLVIVGFNLSFDKIEKLMRTGNVILVPYNSKDKYNSLIEYLDDTDVKYTSYDNTKPNKDAIIKFIETDLDIDKTLAEYIAKRVNYYLPSLEATLDRLKLFDKVTKQLVLDYTDKRIPTSFYTLFQALIGINSVNGKEINTSMRIKNCIRLLEVYQYKPKPLYTFLLKEIEKYLSIYGYIIEGTLTIDNYISFKSDREDLKDINVNQIPYIFDAFKQVSYEKLYAIGIQLRNIKPTSKELYKIVVLLNC